MKSFRKLLPALLFVTILLCARAHAGDLLITNARLIDGIRNHAADVRTWKPARRSQTRRRGSIEQRRSLEQEKFAEHRWATDQQS